MNQITGAFSVEVGVDRIADRIAERIIAAVVQRCPVCGTAAEVDEDGQPVCLGSEVYERPEADPGAGKRGEVRHGDVTDGGLEARP